ncbi:transposase [Streptomyces lonegramiae]|uniref:Transposase n=1 Tax=Streptomyces lonegramiae TaxID=3075524 RepID=A0ABU2XFU1_9ACTN|nr:transposase [Streptomyces sp. DSM 41529]MDT0544803.1 transposase [Streptomyces sp. DSM 41529]
MTAVVDGNVSGRGRGRVAVRRRRSVPSRWSPGRRVRCRGRRWRRAGGEVGRGRRRWRTCRPCPFQEQCTSSAPGRRMLTLRPREAHEALVRARAEQKTETWKAKYALRASVECTINQALDITGMRRARYRGLPEVRLQHAFPATALT